MANFRRTWDYGLAVAVFYLAASVSLVTLKATPVRQTEQTDNTAPLVNAYPGASQQDFPQESAPVIVAKTNPQEVLAPVEQCSVDDYVKKMSLTDFEHVIERFAKNEHISVFGVLRELYAMFYASSKRRGQLKDGSSSLKAEAMALQELCMNSAVAISKLKGATIVPPPIPAMIDGAQYDFGDGFPLFIPPSRMLRPPPGAKIVVEGSSNDVQFPDTVVTVSPQMSVVETLRKAAYKFQAESPTDTGNFITMGFSAALSCYAVSSVGSTTLNEENAWEVSVLDKDNQLIYRSFCLPSRDELVILPRTTIVLTYTSISPAVQPPTL